MYTVTSSTDAPTFEEDGAGALASQRIGGGVLNEPS